MAIFNSSGVISRTLAYVLSGVVVVHPFHAIAAQEQIREAASAGQNFASMLKQGMTMPGDGGNGALLFPGIEEQVSIKDLYPGTSGTSGHEKSYFAPAGDDVGTATEHFNDGPELDRKGLDKQTALYGDAVGGDQIKLGYTSNLESSPTIQGAAYKIILDRKNAAKPDMRNDPGINASRDLINDINGSDFADCKLIEQISKKKGSIHMPDLEQCNRIKEFVGEYDITHEYDLGIVKYVDGKPNYESCGEGCLNIWVGTVGDNYWGGTCKIYEEYTSFEVINHGAIKSVTIDSAIFDDYFQIYLAGEMVWTHTPGIFPPETEGACERKTSWHVVPGVDVTSVFKESTGAISFKTRTSVTGGGEGYARLRIEFDPKEAFRSKGWEPPEHKDVMNAVESGLCQRAEVECTSPPGMKLDECVTYMGVKVCPSDLDVEYNFVNPLCRAATIDAECSFHKGDMGCWDVPGQGEFCHDNQGDILDSCTALEEQGCGFIKSECLLASEKTGTCFIYDETWDCGKSVNYEEEVVDGEFVCEGSISCMGEECLLIDREPSGSFGKAAALLNVMEHADGMMKCDENPGSDDMSGLSDCTIFKGEESTCKQAMGGVVDCCEKPKGISLGDYLDMLRAMKKIDAAMVAIKQNAAFPGTLGPVAEQYITSFREPVTSAYGAMKDKVVSGFKEITKPFINYAESSTATTTATFSQMAVDKVLQAVEKVLGEAAKEFMGAMLKELGYEGLVQAGAGTAAGAAGENVAEQGAQTLAQSMGSAVGSIISVIGWVYMIYQIAMLIIQMIYKCTKDEMQLMVEVALKKCTFLGSYCDQKVLGMCTVKKQAYCCYDSPLARIVVEQGVGQLGRTQGTAKAPQCDGLTLAELELLDWDKIDLSEWTGMLIEHNLYAGTAELTMNGITGPGSYLPGEEGGERADVKERTELRFEDTYIDDIRSDLSQKMDFAGGKPK